MKLQQIKKIVKKIFLDRGLSNNHAEISVNALISDERVNKSL